MTSLYIDRRGRRVRVTSGRLEITGPDIAPSPLPLARLSRIVLLANTELDSSTLSALAEADVALHVLPQRSSAPAVTVLPSPHADTLVRCQQILLLADPGARLRLSTLLLSLKTEAQRGLMLKVLATRPDQRLAVLKCLGILAATQRRLARVKQAPDPLTAQAGLLGIEGSAASAYYAAMAAVMPDSLGFTGRRRRPPPDLINAALSLLYTLATAEAARCAAATGLDPAVGVLHTPTRGRASLACDLVEPVRPSVDHLVWRLVAEQTLRAHHGRPQPQGGFLLTKEGRALVYPAWEALRPRLAQRMTRLARAWVRHLRQRPVPWRQEVPEGDD